jgi:hypothetical protein
MASTWRYSVTLIDTKALKTTLNFVAEFDGLGLTEEFDAAQIAAGALKTDLEAVSDANVYSESLTYVMGGSSSLPADADITDELAIVAFLTPAAEAPKYHTLRVPAPIAAAFESDGVTLDETNSDVIAYVDNFETWEVSDGEHVVTANANGISHGFWRSRAKSTN